MHPQTDNKSDIADYFCYASQGIEVVQDGLQSLNFGEYLVTKGAITRSQLFAALQLQDQSPGVRLGECIAKTGALEYVEIEAHLAQWNQVSVIEA